MNDKITEKINLSVINESSTYIPNKIKFKKKLKLMDSNMKDKDEINADNNLIQKNKILETQSYKNEIDLDKKSNESNKSYYNDKNGKIISSNLTSTKKFNFALNNDNKNEWIIDIINLKDLFIPICFLKERKNIYKILLKETMEIITEKFDILNIFRDLCSIEDIKKYSEYNFKTINLFFSTAQWSDLRPAPHMVISVSGVFP